MAESDCDKNEGNKERRRSRVEVLLRNQYHLGVYVIVNSTIMPPKTTKEKIEAEIRRLSKLEGNKQCVDCNEKVNTFTSQL